LEAEILDDFPGALWTRAMVDLSRVDKVPDMRRVVVAIDPSGTDGNDEGDTVGIVVAGVGVDGRGYVLADESCILSPDGWARRAITAYHMHKADRIVAEVNYGGAMVESVIRSADRSVPYKSVTASRGKSIRAEPISALYEQGRISHMPGLSALEDQMMMMTASGFAGEGSPDRVDALVWALTEVMLGHQAVARGDVNMTVPKMVTPFARR
jgi:phage terminase large subunit-like protein